MTDDKAFFDRLDALPAHVVYGQLTGRESWGESMQRLVPQHMRKGFVIWAAFGRDHMLGGFMRALLENDLMRAYEKADGINTACMQDWVMFLYNYAHSGSYGGVKQVDQWKGMLVSDPEEDTE